MNLSPIWVGFLAAKGFDAVHWSQIGDLRATDATIMQWARPNDHVVFTHDLGFSALLAAGGQDSPSVIQVRSEDACPKQSAGGSRPAATCRPTSRRCHHHD